VSLAAPTRGLLRLGQLRGVALQVHWSAVLPVLAWSGLLRDPMAVIGMVVVLLVHVGGHALFSLPARGAGLRSLTLDGTGGWAEARGERSATARRRLAWGGSLAQAALLIAAVCARPWVALLPPASGAHALLHALLVGNLLMLLLNVLPMGRFDGAEGWPATLSLGSWRPRSAPLGPTARRPPAGPAIQRAPAMDLPAADAPVPPEVSRAADAIMEGIQSEHRRRRRRAPAE
jgi:hypothetical protein